MWKAHVMMIPFPIQGHIIPLLKLAHILATHHIRVTFVNVEFIHDRVLSSFSGEEEDDHARIRFVSVADGLESAERYIPGKLTETLYKSIPQKIEELVKKIDLEEEKEEGKVRCLIYDQFIGSVEEVAKKMGIGSAAFLPAAAALLVLGFNIPNLIHDGIIDNHGTPLERKTLQLASTMPLMSPSDFVWHRVQSISLQKLIFDIMTQNNRFIHTADWVICNSVYALEQGAFALAPRILPIGPLIATNSAGHFIKQDLDCLDWLDQQPPCSVVYVAFGSSTMLDKIQFQELALGLEQTNRPFLWVVRPDTIPGLEKHEFPEGFLKRASSLGRITGWAPQQKVLSHPSVACFVTHCGWNSTIESVSNGVPMLCWPYFADQFINRSYICDIWRVGLRFDHDRCGAIISRDIKKMIDQLLGDDAYKERALQLMKMIERSSREGGDSYKNLNNLISWIIKL